MDKRIEELLPLYALGGLTGEEQAQVEAYVAEHPEARAELDALLAVTAALPFAAPPMPPAPDVKHNLLRRVNQDAHRQQMEQKQPAVAPTTGEDTRPGLWAWLRGQAAGLALAGVTLILLFFAGGWALGLNQTVQSQEQQLSSFEAANAQLSGRVADLETQVTVLEAENANLREDNSLLASANADQVAEIDQLNQQLTGLAAENETLAESVADLQADADALSGQLTGLAAENAGLTELVAIYESLVGPDAVVTTLSGTENQPDAVAQLVTSPDGKTAFLVVSDLEPLEEGLAYQVLLIYDEGHDTAETFLVDTTGHGVSLVSSDGPLLDNYTAIGVSIEPEGGSEQRTGDIVLLGTIGS